MRWTEYVGHKVVRATIALAFLTGWWACSPKLEQRQVFPLEMRSLELDDGLSHRNECCTDPNSYIPDAERLEFFPQKEIRVNFHFMRDEAGLYNIPVEKAKDFVMSLYWSCNERLIELEAPFLPPGNTFGKTPTQYRYVLTPSGEPGDDGIYHHYDDELYYMVAYGKNRNNYDRAVIQKYARGLDSILNIFIMPHHPDSITSPTYKNARGGIALGKAVKISGTLEPDESGWQYNPLTNHEVGHVLGLQHTWSYNDGCDDTPRHPNCWNKQGGGACDTMASNNMMDYNAWQNALSPCQVGLVHRNLAREHMSIRGLLRTNWCRRDTNKTITIRDSVAWLGAKDLEGDIIIEDGGRLHIMCRVSMPAGSSILVRPGGSLYLDKAKLHNACEDQWQGIITEKLGKKEGHVFRIGDVLVENVAPLE